MSRLTKPNEVEGHPGWTFGLIIRREDGSAYCELRHEPTWFTIDLEIEAGESKHVAACRAIAAFAACPPNESSER